MNKSKPSPFILFSDNSEDKMEEDTDGREDEENEREDWNEDDEKLRTRY